MKKLIALSILIVLVFNISYVLGRDNTTTQYSKNNISNKVEVSKGNKYSNNEQPKEEVQNTKLNEKSTQEKREEIQNQIKAKQKEIVKVQNSRSSARSIETKINQLKLEIKELQKELNSIK